MSAKKTAKARALVDLENGKVKCGQFFSAESSVVQGFVNAGQADDKVTEKDVYGDVIPAAVDLTTAEPAADAGAAE